MRDQVVSLSVLVQGFEVSGVSFWRRTLRIAATPSSDEREAGIRYVSGSVGLDVGKNLYGVRAECSLIEEEEAPGTCIVPEAREGRRDDRPALFDERSRQADQFQLNRDGVG